MDDREWLEKLYNDTYALLIRVGRAFLASTSAGQDPLEDEIQEVFLLAYAKRDKLKSHPCPEGWLVEALRKRLLNYYRKWRRQQGKLAFSLDRDPALAPPAPGEDQTFSLAAESCNREGLYRLLGREDAELFYLYCVERMPAADLAGRFSLSEAGVRVRASRIRKKILDHPELFFAIAILLLLRF